MRVIVLSLVWAAFLAAAEKGVRPLFQDPRAVIVHEWGTFTSIAGADGTAVEWLPQAGPADLPCFVARHRFNVKGSLSGTVRMETPVVYFYAAGETMGIYHQVYTGSTSVLRGLVFGRRAGEHAATRNAR